MTSSTSTSFHLNVIININIIASQCHDQHQYHLISISSSTLTSSHLNVMININIIPSQCHQYHLISISSSTSAIISSQYHHQHQQPITFHIYAYRFMPGIHIPQVFRQHKSHTITIHNTTRLIF